MCAVERLTEEVTRFSTAIAPPQQSTQVDECARPLQPRVALLECEHCLAQELCPTLAACDKTYGALRDTQCTWRPECPCELELVARQTRRRLTVAQLQMSKRGI